MSDNKKGLPVRTEGDVDNKVQVKIVDCTTPTQCMIVDTDGNAHTEIHGNDPGGVDRVILTSEEGHISINGIWHTTTNTDPANIGIISHTRNATPTDTHQVERTTAAVPADDIANATIHAIDVNSFLMGYDPTADQWDRIGMTNGGLNVNADIDGIYNGTTNTDPDNIGVVWHTRATTPGDTNQLFRPTGVNGTDDDTVWAIDVAMHDEAGNAYTRTNPFPVYITDEAGGDDVHDFEDNGLVDVTAGADDNHDYTVTALKTLVLKQIQGSSSGRARFELKIETGVAAGTFTTEGVWFTTESNPWFEHTFAEPLEVAAGIIVRLVRNNRDDDDQCIYSFINGEEL